MINDPFIVFLNTDGIFLLIAAGILYVWKKQGRKEAIRLIALTMVTGIFTLILKELFSIPRPFVLENIEPNAGLAKLGSFPSSHTALAFSVATSLTFHKKAIGIFFILFATMIGVGRVAADVHYPIDFFAGIVIGVLMAIAFKKGV